MSSDATAPTATRWPTYGLVLMALMILSWGMNWPASKFALNEVDPLLQRSIALLAGGTGLLVLARIFGYSLRVPRRELRPLISVTLFHITGWHVASAYGLSMMPAGRASIIANTIPIWVTLLGIWLLREPLTWRRTIGLTLGLGGLALLIGPDIAALGRAPLGALLMVVAAICAGAGTIGMKAYVWQTPLTVLAGWTVLIGGIPIYLAAWLTGAGLTDAAQAAGGISFQAVAGLCYTVVMATIFCHWCWFKIVVLFPAPVAAISMFGVPVVGVLGSAALLGEKIGWAEIGALVLVLAGIACVVHAKRTPAVPPPVDG
ncbi:MAG: DMT family transporter [Rhodospirillaceae bacterium]|nr:DMT family transporter [Rhodospirillaceae bacterium]